MSGPNIGIKELIKELSIDRKEVEFSNDLNLFLNIIAFEECDDRYYSIIKEKFDDYMGRWNIDLSRNFYIISQYIKSKKLPYKILKDEGFKMVKSEKFIISMLVDIYAMNIIIDNDEISKSKLINFIYNQLKDSGLKLDKKNIILNDLDYLFKNKNLNAICKNKLIENKKELRECLVKVEKEIQMRKNIKLKLQTEIIEKGDKNNLRENVNKEVDTKNQEGLEGEIEKLEKYNNIELIEYGKEQYSKALIDLVKYMNDDMNGNLLDRLYCYLKGNDDVNIKFIVSNLINVFRQQGIFPREIIKLGTEVEIQEYSFYNYRLNKDISDIKLCSGQVLYPAWFYNDKEILKPYVNIKEDVDHVGE